MGVKNDEHFANDVKKTKQHQPKKPPGLLARLLFFWTFPYFFYGNRRDLEEYDLVPARSKYSSKLVGDQLER